MKTIQVVAAIIKKGNKIFATQRGYGEFKDGWEFPGGKVEPNETKEAAIRRRISYTNFGRSLLSYGRIRLSEFSFIHGLFYLFY